MPCEDSPVEGNHGKAKCHTMSRLHEHVIDGVAVCRVFQSKEEGVHMWVEGKNPTHPPHGPRCSSQMSHRKRHHASFAPFLECSFMRMKEQKPDDT